MKKPSHDHNIKFYVKFEAVKIYKKLLLKLIKDKIDSSVSIISLNKNLIGDEAPVPDDGIKPTFTERPVIRQTDDGGKITFECRCVGDPKPTIAW